MQQEEKMFIRPITLDDVENFYHMMCRLDEETEYMMYEPGERQLKANNPDDLKERIEVAVSREDFLMVAVNDNEEIVGYIWAEREKMNRISHTAYIITGILKAYHRQGIGSKFFNMLDEWAAENGIVRLELTVECVNTGAKHLYEKNGFTVEGVRPKSMKVNGRFVDEYYMGKILD